MQISGLHCQRFRAFGQAQCSGICISTKAHQGVSNAQPGLGTPGLAGS